MQNLILVALGGAFGSVSRYGVNRWIAQSIGSNFPWATMLVNISGSFLIGFLSILLLEKTPYSEPMKLLMITGFLGGFTTFSAFSLDAVTLISRGAYGEAGTYILLCVIPSITATILGLAIARALL